MSRYTKLKFNDPTLNIPGMIIKFLPSGKVIFKVDGETSHFTLHPGRRSGIIDIHKTDELAHDGETSKYETIGKISQDELITRLSVMDPKFLLEFLSLIRPIRLGWVIRRRLCIGAAFPPDSILKEIREIRIAEGNAELSEPFKTWMQPPEFYDEVLQHPGRAFYLFDCKKPNRSTPYGLLFTHRGTHGHVQLTWLRCRDLLTWAKKWEPLVADLLSPLCQ